MTGRHHCRRQCSASSSRRAPHITRMLTEALLGLLLLIGLYIATRMPSGLPPGVWGWPVVGHLPSKTLCLADQVTQLRQVYGDVITWRIGSRIFVFVCDFATIKTTLTRSDCTSRPDFTTYRAYGQGDKGGIIFNSGPPWQANRRFVLRHLAAAKPRLEEVIQEEAAFLVEDFKSHAGQQPQELPPSCGVAVLNVILRLIAGRRYDLEDPKGHEVFRLVSSGTQNMQGPVVLFNFFPWLEAVAPAFLKRKLGLDKLLQSVQDTHAYITTLIEEREASLDPAQPRDLLDDYMVEMHDPRDDHGATMNLEALRAVVTDLLGGGTETTAATVRWAVLYLARYPEVQARVQREIDAVVPEGTLPSLRHKDKLPYLEAVVHEVHRTVSFIPLGAARWTSRDTQLKGYTLPKGCIVVGHLECCHRNPRYWERPHQFYPEHFLDQQGKFVTKKEGFFPFSTGYRSCVGEAVANTGVFLLLSTLLKTFTFSAPDGEDLPTERDPQEFVFNFPKAFRVIITQRK